MNTIARLQTVLQKALLFELCLCGIRTFFHANRPVIYLAVEATSGLLTARQAALEALGPDKCCHRGGAPGFTPHLTLAMRLSGAAASSTLEALLQSEWLDGRWIVPSLNCT